MKDKFKKILKEPLSICFNQINRNLAKRITTNIIFSNFHWDKKFDSNQLEKKLMISKNLQFLFKKIIYQEIKKYHLNVSQSWISQKYSFFLFRYQMKTQERKDLISYYSQNKNYSYRVSKPNYFNFLSSTNKFPSSLCTNSLDKKKPQNLKFLKLNKAKIILRFQKLSMDQPIINFQRERDTVKRILDPKVKYKKILRIGTGFSYLVLFNVNPYQLNQKIKCYSKKLKKISFKTNKIISLNLKVKDSIYFKEKNLNSSRTIFKFIKHSSQVLTTYFLIPKKEYFSLRTLLYSTIKASNFQKNSKLKIKKNQNKQTKSNSSKDFFNLTYPLYFDFNSKLNALEKNNNKKNKSLSFLLKR